MSLHGTVVAHGNAPSVSGIAYPTSHQDTFNFDANAAGGKWLYCVVVGDRCTKVSDGTPWGSSRGSSFDVVLSDTIPNVTYNDPPPSGPLHYGTAQFDLVNRVSNASIPAIQIAAIVKTVSITTSDIFKIDRLPSGSGGTPSCNLTPFAYMFIAIDDVGFDETSPGNGFGDWKDFLWEDSGTNFNASGSNGTVFNQSTSGATFVDSGRGAVSLVTVAWDDVAQDPVVSGGWTHLGTYKDSTTGWCMVSYGKQHFNADTGPDTLTATFSSAVNGNTEISVWQSDEPSFISAGAIDLAYIKFRSHQNSDT